MRRLFIGFLSLLTFLGTAQDVTRAHQIVDTLTSSYFWGRGYTNNGMAKAADFLAAEFKSYGLHPIKASGFQQSFYYSVNTFPGKMEVAVDGQVLKPGIDFIIGPESRGKKVKANLVQQDSVHFIDLKNKIEVELRDKLTWSVSTEQADYTRIEIDKKKLLHSPKTISINMESQMLQQFKSSNVCGIVRGTSKPDSLLVITAHYDHLGGMGDRTYFPGANDNASGTALLLALAKYYAANPTPYSIAFICFGGEEAGLVGSKYFSENPLFALSKIRFLINVDLAGTGDEGITVVNGSVFKKEFSLLTEINNSKQYLSKIKSRGKAANSDHYWFTEKGVPSFFIYAMGGIQAYHDVHDRGETLPLTEFEDLFRLLVQFNQSVIN
jgi:aminopeptidase YwaD